MRRVRISLRVAFIVLAGIAVAGPAGAQQNTLPQDPLRLATEVGRYLFAYDQAANRASAIVISRGVDAGGVEASLVRQHRDGHWTVGLGRLTGEGGFRLVHEVAMNQQRRIEEVRTGVDRTLPRDSYYARAARAQQVVRDNFEGGDGPYNLLVLPAGSDAGHMTVYVIPAQVDQRSYRLGGDHRFEVDPASGEVVSRTPLHEGTYTVGGLGQQATASGHEAIRPVETDVLFATIRRPRAPHFVVTEQQVYRIDASGEIASVSRASFEQANVRMASAQ